MFKWFLIYSRWVPLPIYGRFWGFTLLIYSTKTWSELVGQASSLKRKVIGFFIELKSMALLSQC